MVMIIMMAMVPKVGPSRLGVTTPSLVTTIMITMDGQMMLRLKEILIIWIHLKHL